MRILLLTENPVLALGLEAALLQAGHDSLLLCSTIAQLRGQLAAAVDPPSVLVLDHTHVGMAVLLELKEEITRVHTVLWADDIAVEFGYQALTLGVRGILRKSWPAEVLVATLEKVSAGELCYEMVLSDQFLVSGAKAVTHQEGRIIALLAQGQSFLSGCVSGSPPSEYTATWRSKRLIRRNSRQSCEFAIRRGDFLPHATIGAVVAVGAIHSCRFQSHAGQGRY